MVGEGKENDNKLELLYHRQKPNSVVMSIQTQLYKTS